MRVKMVHCTAIRILIINFFCSFFIIFKLRSLNSKEVVSSTLFDEVRTWVFNCNNYRRKTDSWATFLRAVIEKKFFLRTHKVWIRPGDQMCNEYNINYLMNGWNMKNDERIEFQSKYYKWLVLRWYQVWILVKAIVILIYWSRTKLKKGEEIVRK